jgi:hypothetical protein
MVNNKSLPNTGCAEPEVHPKALSGSSNARLASLDVLRETTIPAYLDPTPSDQTLRAWFEMAHIPRFKMNPLAKKGGGQVYYSVAAVEKFLRSRTLGGAQ